MSKHIRIASHQIQAVRLHIISLLFAANPFQCMSDRSLPGFSVSDPCDTLRLHYNSINSVRNQSLSPRCRADPVASISPNAFPVLSFPCQFRSWLGWSPPLHLTSNPACRFHVKSPPGSSDHFHVSSAQRSSVSCRIFSELLFSITCLSEP